MKFNVKSNDSELHKRKRNVIKEYIRNNIRYIIFNKEDNVWEEFKLKFSKKHVIKPNLNDSVKTDNLKIEREGYFCKKHNVSVINPIIHAEQSLLKEFLSITEHYYKKINDLYREISKLNDSVRSFKKQYTEDDLIEIRTQFKVYYDAIEFLDLNLLNDQESLTIKNLIDDKRWKEDEINNIIKYSSDIYRTQSNFIRDLTTDTRFYIKDYGQINILDRFEAKDYLKKAFELPLELDYNPLTIQEYDLNRWNTGIIREFISIWNDENEDKIIAFDLKHSSIFYLHIVYYSQLEKHPKFKNILNNLELQKRNDYQISPNRELSIVLIAKP